MITEYLGIPVFYTTTGTRRPIVFLHGFLETSKIWKPFIEEISTKRQVICIDLPGHGKTGNFQEIHTMELMAVVVNTVLEKLNVPKATLVGHSMGGYVSLAFAEKHPHKISGIILMNSTPEADNEDRKLKRDRAAKLVRKNKKAFISMAISNLVSPNNADRFKKEIEELKEEAFKLSENGIVAALKGMKIRTSQINLLRQLISRKIMICGTNDSILSLDTAKTVAELCKCSLITVEGGHLSYIENYSNIRDIVYFVD